MEAPGGPRSRFFPVCCCYFREHRFADTRFGSMEGTYAGEAFTIPLWYIAAVMVLVRVLLYLVDGYGWSPPTF